MDDLGGTLIGVEAGTIGAGSVTSMEPTVTAPADPNPNRDTPGRDGACDTVDLAFLAPSNRTGSLGKIGSYDVYDVLGLGGMGIVLKAVDKALNRTVAVKVQNPLLALDSRSRGRFLREARAVAAINHPNVVTIYSVNVVRGRPYLVMEYIRGGSLRQRIKSGPPLATVEVLRCGLQVAMGLAAAHDRGLIHRDIKPANILLEGPEPVVKITDFGLAVANPGVATVATAGKLMGTPAYMSPEQIRGEPLDVRSDLFSLGSVLYAMVVGRSPFAAGSPREAIDRVRNHVPEPLAITHPGCPAALAELIGRLLRKSPDERPASASEVIDRFREILVDYDRTSSREIDLRAPAPQPVVAGEPARPGKPRRVLAAIVGGLLKQARAARKLGRPPLTVSRAASSRHPSVKDALEHARPGDTIRLLDDHTYDDALVIDDPARLAGLTIEAIAGATLQASGPEASVVEIRGVPEVTLRNLTIVSRGNQFGIGITGSAEGMTIDRVRFVVLPSGN